MGRPDEARRIASNIAKLPVLLGQARSDNRPEAESNLSMSVMRPKTPRRNRTKRGELVLPYGAEMRPPFEVELWKPVDDSPHILAVTASFEAAKKAYQEAIASLRLGEVVRVRDAVGTLLLT